MASKLPKIPRLNTSRHLDRNDDGSSRYREKRGLREVDITLGGVKKSRENPGSIATRLQAMAGDVLKFAGEKSVQQIIAEAESGEIGEALLSWVVDLDVKWGLTSPIAAAGRMLALNAVLKIKLAGFLISADGSDDAGIKRGQGQLDRLMVQIHAFADAWHWWHMEWEGEHELAFAKVEHAARQAKGSQTMANKGAQRTAIIRGAIDALRMGGKVDMNKVSAVAKAIKPVVDRECSEARLSVSVGAAAFEKLVGNVVKTIRKG
jgi:hypothetical protein